VAVDLWAFLDELVCLPLIGGRGPILRAFWSSALWQIYETLYLSPLQDAGMQVYNSFSGCRNHSALHGGWDTHSALGLQTQQVE
jgi:hypothetical protein